MDFLDQLIATLTQHNKRLVCAESCTGGRVAALVTARAGVSSIFDGGVVTYSNQAKIDLLQVSAETLSKYGAVSAQVACEMARGALSIITAPTSQISVSITGIAGPDGGGTEKPVGLVYIATCQTGRAPKMRGFIFTGTRDEIQHKAAHTAIIQLLEVLKNG
jgi:PncC family amidohydrolase